jgi:hypothetical protein
MSVYEDWMPETTPPAKKAAPAGQGDLIEQANAPPKTVEVYADTLSNARPCRVCPALIQFAQVVKSGHIMPLDAEVVALRTRHDEGRRLILEVDLATSHFATCPNRDSIQRSTSRRRGTAQATRNTASTDR